MGTKRLTDITSVTGITLSDLIHIVVTGDTSQNAAGSSYKASLQQVYNAFNIPTSFTFTGNTSASCITDLYVTNLYGCSPITVNDTLTITNGNVIKSNGGGELNLNYLNDPSTVILSTDNGNFNDQAQLYLGPFNRGPGGYIELSTYFSAGTTYIAGGYDISNKVLGDIILGDMSGYPGYSTGSGVKIRRMADFLTGVPSEIIELYNNGILVSGLTVDIGESVRINKAYTLPIADGSNGYVLTTDGSGNTTWQAPTGGGSGGTTTSITGFTYSNNNFRIAQNDGTNYVANISTMTGLTVNGALSATTVNKLSLGIGTRNGVPPGPYFENIAIGQESLQKNTTGNNNIAIGNGTLIENTTGSDNVTIVPIGLQYASNNFNNTAVGAGNPGPLFSLGVDVNSFSGLPIAYTNPGNNNTAIGAVTLITNFSGSNNTAIGMESLYYYVGHNNTAVGYQSGVGLQSTSWVATSGDAGSENTFLGYKADNTVGGLTNATAIGANAKVSASNSLVLGNNANVGIGVSAPSEKLEVSGKTKTSELQVTTNPVNGYVLTSDASGNATWQASGFQYEIGEYVPSEGGIIFHRWKSNTSLGVPTNGSFENYMVVTTGDTSTSAEYGFHNTNTSADSSWDGSGNTQTLVSFSGSGTYAAYLCTQVNNGGKTDWYLPSINELVRLMSNRLELEQTLSFIGGDTLNPTTSTTYWSSTEYNFFPYSSAFYYLTDQNSTNTDSKLTTNRVRAIRKFSI